MDLLIIFQKNLIEGKVKTRLASGMGHVAALRIYSKLVDHTLELASNLDVKRVVYYSDFIPENIPDGFSGQLQVGGDLGMRMLNAMNNAFHSGYSRVVLIGTDCYDLSYEIVENAFEQLLHNDYVIGPAKDGGYYLISGTRADQELFKGKNWSHNEVYNEAVNAIEQLNLSHGVLPLLSDIDEPEDVPEDLLK